MNLQQVIDQFCKTYLKDIDIKQDTLNELLVYFMYKDLDNLNVKDLHKLSIKIKQKLI